MSGGLLPLNYRVRKFRVLLQATRLRRNPMEKSIYTKDYAIFLQCLRQARKRAGLTQQHIAEKLETTQSVISKCERGERRIDVVELREFCKAMGVPLREFIESLESIIESGGQSKGD